MRLLLLFCCLLLCYKTVAQHTEQEWVVTKTSGDSIKGDLLNQNETSICLKVALDTVCVLHTEIEDMFLRSRGIPEKEVERDDEKERKEIQERENKGLWELATKSGETYLGRLFKKDSQNVYLILENEDTTGIPLLSIRRIEKVKQVEMKKELVFFDLHTAATSKYFFGSNALGLKKGEGYYQNSLLFYNEIGYGVADWCSIHLSGFPSPIENDWGVIIAPSVDLHTSLIKNKLSIGISGTVFPYPDIAGMYTLYLTIGGRRINLTAGLTALKEFDEREYTSERLTNYFINLKLMARFSPKTLFILEDNYLIESFFYQVGLAAIGFRTTWNNKLSFSYALAVLHAPKYSYSILVDAIPFPLLSFSYNF